MFLLDIIKFRKYCFKNFDKVYKELPTRIKYTIEEEIGPSFLKIVRKLRCFPPNDKPCNEECKGCLAAHSLISEGALAGLVCLIFNVNSNNYIQTYEKLAAVFYGRCPDLWTY